MSNTTQKNNNEKSKMPKWVYAVIVALILGFCVYGYFKINTWVRYAAIERYEKPITDYTITKVYSEVDKYKTKRRGVNDDDDNEKKPQYYMEVSYKDKDYKLELDEHNYSKYNKNPGDITLYYDAKGDDIFVAGSGGENLLVTALGAVALIICVFIFLIIRLFKLLTRKR